MRRSARRKTATVVVNDGAPVELWCICQQPEGGRFMICCDVQGDGCKEWYHVSCVGLSKSQAKHMERNGEAFICPACMSADVLPTGGVVAPSPSVAQLPPYCGLSAPSFLWGDVEDTDFVQRISSAYDVVVHWRRNLFLAPFGRWVRLLFRSWLDYLLLMGRVVLWSVLLLKLLWLCAPYCCRGRISLRGLGTLLLVWNAALGCGGRVRYRNFCKKDRLYSGALFLVVLTL